MKVKVVVLRKQYEMLGQEVVELSLMRASDWRGIAFFRRYFPLGQRPSTQEILDRINADNISFYQDANMAQYYCVEERPRK